MAHSNLAPRRTVLTLLLAIAATSLLAVACADNGTGGNAGDATSGGDASGDATGGSDATGGDDATTGGDTTDDDGSEVDTLGPPPPDTDGDGISDEDEGRAENIDTDGDGTPDYLDSDSDNDGIPDSVEAGDNDPRTPPIDSDGDGIPDFRDLDSDNNGIPDAVELDGDVDGDGIPDFRDRDNDNDFIDDIDEIVGGPGDCNNDGQLDPEGTADAPRDCDQNSIPDYNDIDSDGDTISDRYEGISRDTDGDGFLDRYDLDSDNDGWLDSEEAGDDDVNTPPVDTDGDGIPDYRDLDSDNDGLSDAAERAAGTSRTNPDTDGDGVSDLVEVTAGTDPLDPADNPSTRGDFFFLVPYQQPTTPTVDTLEFATNIQFADLYFSFDTTGSMSAELAAMKNATTGVPAIINQLRCAPTGGTCANDSECVTGVCFNNACITDPNIGQGCIPDLWTGVASWNNVHTFKNIVSLQPDPVATANAVPNTGGGSSEAPQHPPYCVASRSTPGCSSCASTGIGCGGFRTDAVRIYIQVTDADDQCSGAECSNYSTAGAGQALASQSIKFISLYGTDDAGGRGTPESIASEIGVASGTVNQAGQPFVYLAVDAAVVPQTVQAVRDIARGVPLDVTISVTDLPGDDGDALQFIDYLEVNVSGQGRCTPVANVADRHFGDGRPDSFPALLPGTPVCWDVHPVLRNTTQPATTEPQIFRALVTVIGDGSPLDDREVFFLIPPVLENHQN